MWNWLMGQLGRSGDTLVDIVADVFTGVSTALQTIKDNVGEFVDGVKNGVEYYTNIIASKIIDSIIYMVVNALHGIGNIINEITESNIVT